MEHKFSVVELEAQPGLAIKETVAFGEIPAKMAEFLGELCRVAGERHIAVIGPPFAYYHSWNDKETGMEVGFPVGPGAAGEGWIRMMSLPGGRVVSGTHIGPYDKLAESYNTMTAWMKSHGHAPANHMWETYLTDPHAEKDPAKYKTQMFWPVT